MSLSQVSDYRVGQVPNRAQALRNGGIDSKVYPSPTKVQTLTIGGTASDGKYSAEVDGVEFSYTADTGAGDTNTTIAAGLLAAAQSNGLDIYDVVNVTRSALVLTFAERIPGDGFTLANASAPGSGSLTIETVNAGTAVDLPLGVGVSLVAGKPGQIRLPQSGDTKIYGAVTDQGMLRPNEGDPDIADGYREGSAVGVARRCLCVVQVEDSPAPGDSMFCRVEVESGKQLGAFRTDAGGLVQITTGTVVPTNGETVGLTFDSLPDVTVTSTADGTATALLLRNAINARADLAAIVTASATGAVLALTFKDFADHNVVAVSPATADVTPIANTQDAKVAQAVAVEGEFVQLLTPGVAIAEFNLPG